MMNTMKKLLLVIVAYIVTMAFVFGVVIGTVVLIELNLNWIAAMFIVSNLYMLTNAIGKSSQAE